MSKNDLKIQSAIVTTKEKLPNRLLITGKLVYPETYDNVFLFYIIEINCPWTSCLKVKKAIVDELEQAVKIGITNIGQFESLVNNINETLDKVSVDGENIWIGKINAIIGLLNYRDLILTQTGSLSGYIFRGKKISSLVELSLTSDHPLKTFIDITEGELTAGDKLIFANSTLFDHFSLDRLRQLTGIKSAKESILELSRNLRRNRVYDVNSIIIEAVPLDQIENKETDDLPEIIYLDNPDDIWWKNLKKKYGPHVANIYSKTKSLSRSAGSAIAKHGGQAYKGGKEKWQTKYGPKTKELLSKSAPAISRTFKGAREKIRPQFDKLGGSDKFKTVHVKTNHYKSSTGSFFKSIYDFLANIFSIIVNLAKDKEKRKFLYVIGIVILLSIGYFKIRDNNIHRNENKNKQEIALAYDKAKAAYNVAKDNLALGKTKDTTELDEALALAKKAMDDPGNKEEAKNLAIDIQRAIDALTKTTRLYDQKSIFTLNQTVLKIILAENSVYGVAEDGKIYAASIKDKDPRLVASIGKDSGQVTGITYFKSDSKLIFQTDLAKMFELDPALNTQGEIVVNDTSGKWEKAVAIANYTSNLYLLDSEAGEIFKHTQIDGGYSKGISYANTKNTDGIKGSVDIAIDGSVYVLKSDGTVAKFTKGVYDSVFMLKNMPVNYDKIEQPAKLFTNADTNYIYLLDKKLNRIIRFDKSGEFVGQYSAFDLVIDDFVVNDKVKKMWYLSTGNIYEIDL